MAPSFRQTDRQLWAAATFRQLMGTKRGTKDKKKTIKVQKVLLVSTDPLRPTATGIYFPKKWERNAPGTFEEDSSCEGEIRSLEDINDLEVQT